MNWGVGLGLSYALFTGWLMMTGRLVAARRRRPCADCQLRSLTLGAPGLVQCEHKEMD